MNVNKLIFSYCVLEMGFFLKFKKFIKFTQEFIQKKILAKVRIIIRYNNKYEHSSMKME